MKSARVFAFIFPLKLSCALLSCLLLCACTMWKEHPVRSNWSEVTGGESLERSFWHDIKAKDWTELERHISGNYVAVTPQGRLDRAAALARLQQVHLDDYSLGDFQVEMNGSTLVVAYTLTLRGSLAGQPLPSSPVHMLGVWQHQKSGWVLIAHSVVGVQE